MPSAVSGSSVVCQPLGRMCSSCASSMSLISAGPSAVLMFHVNATRSRQKLSSWNSAAAASLSPWVRAWSKSDSHRSTSFTVSPPTGTEHREYQQSGDADADRPCVTLDPDQQAQRRPLLGGPAQQRRHRLRLVGAEALEQAVVGGQRLRPAALALQEVARARLGGGDAQAHVRVGGAV